NEARRVDLVDRGVSILAVPDSPVLPALVGNPSAKYNVLVLHGVVQGLLPDWFTAADRARIELPFEELTKADWDYVALGHYHVYQRVGGKRPIYYSGAIDYTGPSVWGELYQQTKHHIKGKGIIEHDLDSGKHIFHVLPPSRQCID